MMSSGFFKKCLCFAAAAVVAGSVITGVYRLSGYSDAGMNDESRYVTTELVDCQREYVIPGGQSVGVKIDIEDVIVAGLEEIETESGKNVNPGLEAGLQIGDVIIAIDGNEVKTAKDVHKLIENTEHDKVNLKIGRKGELLHADIVPVKSAKEGVYRLGLWVKEKTAGIGTLTYYSPEKGTFAALGHGITDAETGKVLNVSEGQLVDARIVSLVEGRKGAPGELKGIFYEADRPLGRLERNCSRGIYGVAYEKLDSGIFENPIEIAHKTEVRKGDAYILTTLKDDKIQKFDIEIEKISQSNREDKNLIIKVTDKSLLNASGGIVQGMSGSPIIQDGRLVGAVTHVLVNDPTRGYGIFIENMLEAER